jgi:hypothetical protein
MASRVTWYASRIQAITTTIPIRAHAMAAQQAAGLAAKMINSKASGGLAGDVARAKPVGPMRAQVGSNRPYARIEHFGGVITPKRPGGRLLIRGNRVGSGGSRTRSTTGGSIEASATSVQHRGKFYLDGARGSFPGLFITALRRMMP